MRKAIICLVLSLGLLISSNSIIFAEYIENADPKEATIAKEISEPQKSSMVISKDLENYSNDSGIPLSELQELKSNNVNIDQFVKEYIEATRFFDFNKTKRSGDSDEDKKMTYKQFQNLCKNSLKGNILLSADQTNFGVKHGHAAIVFKKGDKTVEALGSGIKSKQCNMDGWWSEMYTAKVLYHKTCTNAKQLGAADYANKKLQEKEYKTVPEVTENKLNCATLVWKAYNSQGITLKTVSMPGVKKTCFPKTLDTDPSLSCKLSINW